MARKTKSTAFIPSEQNETKQVEADKIKAILKQQAAFKDEIETKRADVKTYLVDQFDIENDVELQTVCRFCRSQIGDIRYVSGLHSLLIGGELPNGDFYEGLIVTTKQLIDILNYVAESKTKIKMREVAYAVLRSQQAENDGEDYI